jgi:serpin B
MKRIFAVAVSLILVGLPGFSRMDGKEAKAPADTKAVVKGNTEFALALYRQLRGQKGNLFISPYSISTALAMTYAGARGQTAEEMARALNFPSGHQRLHTAFAKLLVDLNGDGKKRGYQLSVANALWGQKNFGFLPDFLNLTRDSYGAGLNEVDFQGATEEARKTINAWVEKQTQDKIKDLLQPGVLNASTCLVLTNAIYFKGFWDSQFNKKATQQRPFHLQGGESVKVPLMYQKGKFRYLDGGDFQALELPYQGKDLSMVILLPKKADGLAALEEKLTASNLAGWLGRLHRDEVHVTLPRFKMIREFRLRGALAALGMRRAFAPGQADFTGMSGSGRKLFVSEVIHKAFVDVNEEGTEAAAATAVIVKKEAAAEPTVFRADHPFLFLIQDLRTGSVLFLGRLTNPD